VYCNGYIVLRSDQRPKGAFPPCRQPLPDKKLIKYSSIEWTLVNSLIDLLDSHSVVGEDVEVTHLRGSLATIEEDIGRLVDAIRFRGFDGSMGEALDGLERDRKKIIAELGETSQKASKSILEGSIKNLSKSVASERTIPEINQEMRQVFSSIVIDHRMEMIRLTFLDGSRESIPSGPMRASRQGAAAS
jgi:hypothetical protein